MRSYVLVGLVLVLVSCGGDWRAAAPCDAPPAVDVTLAAIEGDLLDAPIHAAMVWTVPGSRVVQPLALRGAGRRRTLSLVSQPPANATVEVRAAPTGVRSYRREQDGLPPGSRYAQGRVVLYRDGNGNGRLDLGDGERASPDEILAAPPELVGRYVEPPPAGGSGPRRETARIRFAVTERGDDAGSRLVMPGPIVLRRDRDLQRVACEHLRRVAAPPSERLTQVSCSLDGRTASYDWCAPDAGPCAPRACFQRSRSLPAGAPAPAGWPCRLRSTTSDRPPPDAVGLNAGGHGWLERLIGVAKRFPPDFCAPPSVEQPACTGPAWKPNVTSKPMFAFDYLSIPDPINDSIFQPQGIESPDAHSAPGAVRAAGRLPCFKGTIDQMNGRGRIPLWSAQCAPTDNGCVFAPRREECSAFFCADTGSLMTSYADRIDAHTFIGGAGYFVNYGLATVEGTLRFDSWSWPQYWSGYLDQDYSWDLLTFRPGEGGAIAASAVDDRNRTAASVHCEFDPTESTDVYAENNDEWRALKSAIEGDARAFCNGDVLHGRVYGPGLCSIGGGRSFWPSASAGFNKRAKVLGDWLLDCTHVSCGAEVHPVVGFAVEISQSVTQEKWMVFIRGGGNQAHWGRQMDLFNDAGVTLALDFTPPPGYTAAILPVAVRSESRGSAEPFFTIEPDVPVARVGVHFSATHTTSDDWWAGTVELSWSCDPLRCCGGVRACDRSSSCQCARCNERTCPGGVCTADCTCILPAPCPPAPGTACPLEGQVCPLRKHRCPPCLRNRPRDIEADPSYCNPGVELPSNAVCESTSVNGGGNTWVIRDECDACCAGPD